jgi:uncharacterized repeat protein (TIGR01451 family)
MNIGKELGADLIKAFILSLVLCSLLSFLVLAADIDSTFTCNNTNSETTFYSYLKSPGLDESGYTKGVRTGTLNYYKGDRAYLNDRLVYYDGMNPDSQADHNVSVMHDLTVEFSGDNDTSKGISQFYAKGFYTDNRAVSASKKFWYNSQLQYPTNNISAKAVANMNLAGIYDLQYDASADNAYFVFSDATGFSNKTGARRIDWEQEGLLKGEHVSLINNLRVISAYKPRGGGEDWLPCTCISLNPLNPPDLGEWPSLEAWAVLQPTNLMLLPPNCNYAIEPVVLGKVPCRQAINWRGAASLLCPEIPSGAIEDLQTSATPLVQADSSWTRNAANREIADYAIKVSNLGNIKATNVVVVLKLADNLSYIGGSATVDGIPQDPYRPYNNGSLFWNIGDLMPISGSVGTKTIKLKAQIGVNANPDKSIAYARYKGGDLSRESTIPTLSSAFANVPPLVVDSFYDKISDQMVNYKINVRNIGTADAKNVILIDNLVDGMTYQKGATIDSISGEASEPEISNEGHTLTWDLGSLLAVPGPDGRKTIEFTVKLANETDPQGNVAYATYKIGETNMNTLKANPEPLPHHGGTG